METGVQGGVKGKRAVGVWGPEGEGHRLTASHTPLPLPSPLDLGRQSPHAFLHVDPGYIEEKVDVIRHPLKSGSIHSTQVGKVGRFLNMRWLY